MSPSYRRAIGLLLCAAGSLLFTACGSAVTLRGRVVTLDKAPIAGASVATKPATDSVITNARGFFSLKQRLDDTGASFPIDAGRYTILIKKLGFKDVELQVEAKGGEVVLTDTPLEPFEVEIGEDAPPKPLPPRKNKPQLGDPKDGT